MWVINLLVNQSVSQSVSQSASPSTQPPCIFDGPEATGGTSGVTEQAGLLCISWETGGQLEAGVMGKGGKLVKCRPGLLLFWL